MAAVRPRPVVICDDHPLVRAGMACALAAEPSLAVVAQSEDPRAAIAALVGHPAAVLIVRDRFLDGGVLASADARPGVGVVAGLDRASDERLLILAGRGVQALIRRAGPPDDVRQAALAVSRGTGFIASDLVRPLLNVVRHGGAAPVKVLPAVEHLTPRESEVLRLVARGAANREIATTLRISEKTVKFHVSNLLSKARLRSRAQLIAAVASLDSGAGPALSSAGRQLSVANEGCSCR